jgi:hypothetical protein
MFSRGADVLIKEGAQVAKRVAKLVIPPDRLLHHTGHALRGGGVGRSHFQDAAIRGRHIFYGLIGGVMLGEREAFANGLKADSVQLILLLYTLMNIQENQNLDTPSL